MKKVIIILIIFSLVFVSLFSLKKEEEKANKNISVILETEEGNLKSKTFPSKDEYVYNKTVCENTKDNIKINFDKETWKLDLNVEEDSIDGKFFCNIYFMKKSIWEYDYTGNYQTFVVPINGKYKFELWGAKGESSSTYSYGSFVSGEIELIKEDKMYVFIGGAKGFNGGGKSTVSNQYSDAGGATDIRLTNGEWNNSNSLRSRIMVAAGSGANSHGGFGAPGGGISGYKGIPSTNPEYTGKDSTGGGATQTSGGEAGYFNYSGSKGTAGSFGQGGIGTSEYSGPGGGGYYGGGGAGINPGGKAAGGSGSSYISGHTGCVAITSASSTTPKSGCTTGTTNNSCSVHYSGKVFTNTVMIDGAGYNWTNVKGSLKQMPKPSGGFYESGKGHIGDGYARITLIE